MFAYKITGDTSYECENLRLEFNIDRYPSPEWYLSEDTINWSTHRWVDGKVLPRGVITTPIIEPSVDEIKRAKKLDIDLEYEQYYINIDRAFAAAIQLGNPTTELTQMRIELMAAHKLAKELIGNG